MSDRTGLTYVRRATRAAAVNRDASSMHTLLYVSCAVYMEPSAHFQERATQERLARRMLNQGAQQVEEEPLPDPP
jgi:hypothetical protein